MIGLFFLGVHLLTILPVIFVPRAIMVFRRDTVLRINRFQRVTVSLEIRNRWPLPLRTLLVTDMPGGLFPDLPPVFAVVLELALFGVVPSALSLAGMAVTCAGVAMTVWKGRWRSSISSR